MTASTTDPKPSRQVPVPHHDFVLFRKVGLTVPEGEGQTYDMHDLDQRLAPYDLETRMKVKTGLFNCGLLRGRPI